MTPDTPIYAIGDIHGQLSMLEHALRLIARDAAGGAPVVFLGDYVDRGPDSRGVIDTLAAGLAEGAPWIVLKGNHDRFMQAFLRDPDWIDPRLSRPINWLDPVLGGRETLESYGVDVSPMRSLATVARDAREAVPEAHLAFLDGLALSHETADLFFAHAGIRPGVALADQVEDDLVWIRQEFHRDPRDHGKLIVHGHTPVDAPRHYGNRVNLDTGAGYDRMLSVAVFDEGRVFTLNDGGRVPLEPGLA